MISYSLPLPFHVGNRKHSSLIFFPPSAVTTSGYASFSFSVKALFAPPSVGILPLEQPRHVSLGSYVYRVQDIDPSNTTTKIDLIIPANLDENGGLKGRTRVSERSFPVEYELPLQAPGRFQSRKDFTCVQKKLSAVRVPEPRRVYHREHARAPSAYRTVSD